MKSKGYAGKYPHSNEPFGVVRVCLIHVCDKMTIVTDSWMDIYSLVVGTCCFR